MEIKELTDLELTERIETLRSKERVITLKFLLHLGEFDIRKLYLELGYSSLFDYCVRKLGYSESSAYRRIESARCLRDNPELSESFLKDTRYIPAVTKRSVLKQNGYQCSYISKDGVRCGEKHYLNFDHIQPYALGGKSSSNNLRVLYSAHNQMLNRMTFGER